MDITIQYNNKNLYRAQWSTVVESEARAVAGRAKGGYTLQVVREVRWVFSRCLNVSSVLDSLIAAGNAFQMVGAEKLKERLLKLVVQEGIHERFWLAELAKYVSLHFMCKTTALPGLHCSIVHPTMPVVNETFKNIIHSDCEHREAKTYILLSACLISVVNCASCSHINVVGQVKWYVSHQTMLSVSSMVHCCGPVSRIHLTLVTCCCVAAHCVTQTGAMGSSCLPAVTPNYS